ncbi:L-lactate permease [Pseudomonas sp. zfem002]|uniref:L-lactate permease n=1 Tax=Pseudomonas sp. zfem002 TaxID=3078197 RepID=UPI0029286B25|nr:L-lactate permease [Pseudomonas sp. zfem002]MDU9394600.1 L-lactate permease [Pseudomonas sp. zfem002]
MNAFLAASPVFSSILALGLGIRSLHAALLGVLAALMAAIIAFPLGTAEIGVALLKWLPLVLEVVLIVGGGLLMSEVLRHAGAQAALANWIKGRAGTGVGAVLLVVHGITPFAESVTGFGIGVTIGIPLLVFMGLPGRHAALIGLLGLCAVPWGSMGPGTMIAAGLAGLRFDELGVASAALSILPFAVNGCVAAWLVSQPGQRPRAMMLALGSALVLTLAVGLSNLAFGTAPAGALGSVAIICLHLLRGAKGGEALLPIGRRALQAYGLLLGGVLVAGSVVRFSGLSEAWHYVASPALWLFVAALWFSAGRPPAEPLARAWSAWLQVAPVTALFIIMGIVMAVSGTAAYLARLLAEIGTGYLAISPFVGALGGFVTGSSSGSNAMFAATQAEIARSLGANLLLFMATHNVAAAISILASPGKIEMALQLAGDAAAQRRWVQRMAIAVVLCSAGLMALVNVLAGRWF